MRCITQRQAKNFFQACKETNHTPSNFFYIFICSKKSLNKNNKSEEFLTVAPPQSVGGLGPNWNVVEDFLAFLKLLSNADSSDESAGEDKKKRTELLDKLAATHADHYAQKRKHPQKHVDLHHIEDQIREDNDLLKLLPGLFLPTPCLRVCCCFWLNCCFFKNFSCRHSCFGRA